VSCYDGTAFRNFTEKDGLKSNTVLKVLEDRDGDIWFLGVGISSYDGETFTAFPGTPSLTNKRGPAHGMGMGMYEDKDGVLWFGCTDGVWRLQGESFINVTEKGPWPKVH
jgi:ligand-binding sensor domain-containing protein